MNGTRETSHLGERRCVGRAIVVTLAVALSLLPALAHAQRGVHVTRIAGDRRGRVQRAIASELAERGFTDGADGVTVGGRFDARRGILTLRIQNGEQRERERITARSLGELAERAAEVVERLVGSASADDDALTTTFAAPGQRATQAGERPTSSSPTDASPPQEAPPDAADGLRDSPTALRVYTGVYVYGRFLSFTANTGAYGIGPGIAAHAGFEWYPARHVSSHPLAHFGLAGFARGFALSPSSVQPDDASGEPVDQQYPTRAHAWELDVRYSFPIEAHSITGGLGLGNEHFGLDPAGPATPDDRRPGTPVPTVDYVYLRPFVQGEVHVYEGLFVGAGFGWRSLLSAGELGDWYPRSEGSGLDVGGHVLYRLTWFLEVRLAIEHHRYFFTLHPQPGDAYVAGGAADEWTCGSLDVIVRLPGERG